MSDTSKELDKKTEVEIPYSNCYNCGAELHGMYCHACGQHATSKTPSVRAFISEYFNTAFIWDSQCLKTIWRLVSRPGKLTREFMEGKFISQENPLKLNMFLLIGHSNGYGQYNDPDYAVAIEPGQTITIE